MKTSDYVKGIYVAPIYKVGVTASIPNIIRGKIKGNTEVFVYYISKYKTAKEIMEHDPEYFFSQLKGIKDELKDKIKIVKEEILATTNTAHTEDKRI